jgi:trimeric autotransporter adhesin
MVRFIRSHVVTLVAAGAAAVLVAGPPLAAAPPQGDATRGNWNLRGNTGTDPAINFLGTIDNKALTIRVNNVRGWQIQPTGGAPNIIGGFHLNSVGPGVFGATIGGGGQEFSGPNSVTDVFGTVSGGYDNTAGLIGTVGGGHSNTASGEDATVAGGHGNLASLDEAAVGGGLSNTASGFQATVAGGLSNHASDFSSTVGGGEGNTASGFGATVPGGLDNTASGTASFAAGRQAKALHNGTFVWADSNFANMASTGINQFIVRATGGLFLQKDSTLDNQGGFINTSTGAFLSNAGVWTDASSRELKENFVPVDPRDVLDRVASLPITSWNYEVDPSARHIGPVSEDFHAAFGVGEDPRHLASLDTGGVALAAIQGLNQRVEDLQAQLSGAERVATGSTGGLGGILPALGMLGLALGIAVVGRRTIVGVLPTR